MLNKKKLDLPEIPQQTGEQRSEQLEEQSMEMVPRVEYDKLLTQTNQVIEQLKVQQTRQEVIAEQDLLMNNEGLFRQELLAALQDISKKLNSIALQIFEQNKIAASQFGVEVEEGQ